MSPWEVMGWLVVIPMAVVSLTLVIVVSGAVALAIVRGVKAKQVTTPTVAKDHPSNVTPIR